MIASSFFIAGKLARARLFAKPKLIAARALLATGPARCNYDFAGIKEMSSRGAVAAKGAPIGAAITQQACVINGRRRGPSLALGMTKIAGAHEKLR